MTESGIWLIGTLPAESSVATPNAAPASLVDAVPRPVMSVFGMVDDAVKAVVPAPLT